ncbi:unnamed protein product [Euphydryas editha]|uniref:Reverse transcriptase domain-containing protein n=1 Tax=Euphydryas editha TaxID=104508 RepID=A0AAU9UWH4_EUPED|nr:unnamed protein product [Euphydryas editha]
MPTDSTVNFSDFSDYIGEISALVEINGIESVFILGDFNAHPEREMPPTCPVLLDCFLNRRLAENIKIHDLHFSFKPGLSTESAIFCLKQTMNYYISRKTPVYACFLDLSKAFNLVSYNLLWKKLQYETILPPDVITIHI